MKHKRKLLFVMVLALALSLCSQVPVSAASGSRKKVVAVVNKFCRSVKANNKTAVKKCCKSGVVFGSGSYSNAYWGYLKKYHKSMSYKIKSVKVSGKTAKVKVRIKYRDLSDVYTTALNREYDWLMDYCFDYMESPSTDEMREAFREYFAEEIQGYKAGWKTRTITLKVVKKGSKWLISDLNDYAYNVIMLGYKDGVNASVYGD